MALRSDCRSYVRFIGNFTSTHMINWDASEDWEKGLEFFEQVKRIADQLERVADSLVAKRKTRIVTTEVPFTDHENKVLDSLDRQGGAVTVKNL